MYIFNIRIRSNDIQLLTTSINLGDNEAYVKRDKLAIYTLINRSLTISREFYQIDGPILETLSSKQRG